MAHEGRSVSPMQSWCWVKVWQLETGCPLRRLFWVKLQSYSSGKLLICKITYLQNYISAKLLNLQNYEAQKWSSKWGLRSVLASRSKFLQLGSRSKFLQLGSRSKFLQLGSRSKLLQLRSLDNLSKILWNPSLISRFPSPKIQFSLLKIRFSSSAFRFPRNPRKYSSTAFQFLQWLSDFQETFFNGFPISSTAFCFLQRLSVLSNLLR
jgi:hypothetical protein